MCQNVETSPCCSMGKEKRLPLNLHVYTVPAARAITTQLSAQNALLQTIGPEWLFLTVRYQVIFSFLFLSTLFDFLQ